MVYEFEKERKNYEDYSSGRVLFNQQGTTGFPVRLASEVFQRCKQHLTSRKIKAPYTILDPCCGGGYLLTTIGLLFGEELSNIYASDIDENAVGLAEKNLSLLTASGIHNRKEQIRSMFAEFGKESHREAFESAGRLEKVILKRKIATHSECLQNDILNLDDDGWKNIKVDLVLTDVPYGKMVHWSNDSSMIMETFLENLLFVLKPTSIVAVVSDKKQLIRHRKYRRIEHFKVGKRQVAILELK